MVPSSAVSPRVSDPGNVVAGEPSACPTRCFLADADFIDRRLLTDLLHDANAIVVGETAHAVNIRATLAALEPDVVFVDARMPPHQVAAIGDAALAAGCLIVVISALPSDAVLGFRLRAVDFLLKPYARSWIQLTMSRVRGRLHELALVADADDAAHSTVEPRAVTGRGLSHGAGAARLAVPVDGGMEYVPLPSVEWIAAVGYGTQVHTVDRVIPTRTSFTTMLRWADDWEFLRTHRGTIVNAQSVRRLDVQRGGTGVLTLQSGRTLPVAKRRLAVVRRALVPDATPAPRRAGRRA